MCLLLRQTRPANTGRGYFGKFVLFNAGNASPRLQQPQEAARQEEAAVDRDLEREGLLQPRQLPAGRTS